MGTAVFNQLLQMNLIGIYGILLAFAVRLLLRKAGSRYCYALWIVVFLNLALPTVLTGRFSLIPKQLYQVGITQADESASEAAAGSGLNALLNGTGEQDTAETGNGSSLTGETDEQGTADSGYSSSLMGEGSDDLQNSTANAGYYDLRNGAVDEVVDITSEAVLDAAAGDASDRAGFFASIMSGVSEISEQAWNQAASAFGGETVLVRCLLAVWISVMLILFVMEGVQYQRTRRRLKSLPCTGTDEANHAVTLDGLETPVLFGFLHPTIYLPEQLKEEERDYILRHELYHRRRKDHIVKAAALCISIVYWYNPLVWAAFHCFGIDMELSCDEAVLLHADTDIRKAYAGSLLKYGALQNHYVLTSLTFGEPGLKARVKHVLQFKKRGVMITAVAVLAIALLAVGLLVRPATEEESFAVQESSVGQSSMEEDEISQETYGWSIKEESIIHHDAVVYEITDAYSYGEITGNYVSEEIAYVAYHLEDARICVLSTSDAGESWQQTYIGEADEMDALGALYLSFLEEGMGYLLYTSSPAAGLMNKVLYTSADAGASFQTVGDITDSVQNYPQWMVFYDENMGMILTQYHGCDTYAYLTTDGGVTWSALDLDVPDAEGSSYIDGVSLIRTNKAMDLWVMHLQAVFDDRVDIYLESMSGWTDFIENGTVTPVQTESGNEEDAAEDPLAHTADQVQYFAAVLDELDEEDYCQILTIHGYSVLLVAEGTYDTSWERGTDHGTIAAEVYFPTMQMRISSMGTAYPLRFNAEGIYVEWNTGIYTIYTLEEESGELTTESRDLNEGEWDTLYDIPFVMKKELLEETGISKEQLQTWAAEAVETNAEDNQNTMTVEKLASVLMSGEIASYDYGVCENAELREPANDPETYYYVFYDLEYEGVGYRLWVQCTRGSEEDVVNSVSLERTTTGIPYILYSLDEDGSARTVNVTGLYTFLSEAGIEDYVISIDLSDGYTFGDWDEDIGYGSDSSSSMSGGVLIAPAAYELQEGYERYMLAANWQYYAGFFALIGEGSWFWKGDTLEPGIFQENHMECTYVEMLEGTAKTAYLLDVQYDLYTAAGQAALEESGADLNMVDTVSEY